MQGITTYEYVMAMRAQSEPPGPSVDGGDNQSLPTSPTSTTLTAISGRSSLGLGLQYKGAWCTPPRIFMDHQVLLLTSFLSLAALIISVNYVGNKILLRS